MSHFKLEPAKCPRRKFRIEGNTAYVWVKRFDSQPENRKSQCYQIEVELTLAFVDRSRVRGSSKDFD